MAMSADSRRATTGLTLQRMKYSRCSLCRRSSSRDAHAPTKRTLEHNGQVQSPVVNIVNTPARKYVKLNGREPKGSGKVTDTSSPATKANYIELVGLNCAALFVHLSLPASHCLPD